MKSAHTHKFDKLLLALSFSLLCAAIGLHCSLGECEGDNDCPLNRVCVNNSCVISCEYEPDRCQAGQVCVNGHCQTACTKDEDCGTQSFCDPSGICLTRFVSQGDSDSSSSGDTDQTAGDADAGTEG